MPSFQIKCEDISNILSILSPLNKILRGVITIYDFICNTGTRNWILNSLKIDIIKNNKQIINSVFTKLSTCCTSDDTPTLLAKKNIVIQFDHKNVSETITEILSLLDPDIKLNVCSIMVSYSKEQILKAASTYFASYFKSLKLDRLNKLLSKLDTTLASKLSTTEVQVPHLASDTILGISKDILKLLNDPNTLQSIINIIGDLFDGPIKYICPTPPPAHDSNISHKYNAITILVLSLIIGILTLVPVIIVAIVVKHRKKKIYIILGIIVTGVLLLTGIFFSNPKCLIKPCPIGSDVWDNKVTGTFKGSHKEPGININATIQLQNNTQDIQFKILTCTGPGCPVNNLLQKCDKQNIVQREKKSTPAGYQLVGSCVDQIQKIDSIKGLYILRKNSQIYIQVLVDVLEVQKYIQVLLTKV